MAAFSEDIIASDAVEDSEPNVSEDLNCSLCLKVFRSPRRLPCTHSFCQDCLQSHISNNTSVKDTFKEFYCPICETVVQSGTDIALDKWVHLFPHNTLLLSLLMKLKVKVDLVCDVCQGLGVTCPARELCIVCEQALCMNCSKMHKYQRLSNTHDILKVEELPSKEDIVLQHNSLFKCAHHAHFPIEHYCKTHEIQLCVKCFNSHHKRCTDVVDVVIEKSNLSDPLNDIKVQIKELEDQFQRVTDINVSNLRELDSQLNNLTQEIRSLKKSINTVLDDLETRVKTEFAKIYNETRNKLDTLRVGFKSQIMSIRNSNLIIEDVSKFATQSQMFQLVKRMLRQLSLSKSQINEKYIKNEILKFELEINPQITSIISIPRGEIATMKIKRNDENPIITTGFQSLKGCKVETVYSKEVKVQGEDTPLYSDVKYISPEYVMLVDMTNNVCHLIDSLFNSVSFYKLSEEPNQLCVVGQSEIAVSIPLNRRIQFLSVRDNTITPTREVITQHQCSGIAIVSQDEIIVTGVSDDGNKCYWSLITLDGKEKSYHEFDGEGVFKTNVALNKFQTRIYISVCSGDSLHCFGFDGKKYFTFKHQDLDGAQNVAIDRDDNVYVLGSYSRNIFQLSPDGVLIQIILDVTPNIPLAMCFNEDGDKFLLTCYESKDLCEFKFALT